MLTHGDEPVVHVQQRLVAHEEGSHELQGGNL